VSPATWRQRRGKPEKFTSSLKLPPENGSSGGREGRNDGKVWTVLWRNANFKKLEHRHKRHDEGDSEERREREKELLIQKTRVRPLTEAPHLTVSLWVKRGTPRGKAEESIQG